MKCNDFNLYQTGKYLNDTGSEITKIVIPIIAITMIKSGSIIVSIILAMNYLPAALLSIPLGAWVEQQPKRKLMIRVSLLSCIALLGIYLVYLLSHSIPSLCLILATLIIEVCALIYSFSTENHLVHLVGKTYYNEKSVQLERNSWLILILGPIISGFLISIMNPIFALLIDAGSYAINIIFLKKILKPAEEQNDPKTSFTALYHDMTEGFRFIFSTSSLRNLILTTAFFTWIMIFILPAESILALKELRATRMERGLMIGLPCIFGFFGVTLGQKLIQKMQLEKLNRWSSFSRYPWLIIMGFTPHSTIHGVITIVLSNSGLLFCAALYNLSKSSLRRKLSPDNFRARITSSNRWFTSMGKPLAAILSGLAIAQWGTRNTILIAAILLMLIGIIFDWIENKSPIQVTV